MQMGWPRNKILRKKVDWNLLLMPKKILKTSGARKTKGRQAKENLGSHDFLVD
jgi:hypothetical protein